MSIITLPDNSFRSINWTLVQPTQVNRSEFTSARQVMQLPGASYWKASAEHVPLVGEANIRAWRSFFAQLRGQSNTFRLRATEAIQQSTSVSLRVLADANTTMVGSSTGSVVTVSADKTAATKTSGSTAFDAAAVTDFLTGPGLLSFRASTTSSVVVGLRSAADPDFGLTSIDYAFRIFSGGTYQIRVLGSNIGSPASFAATDVFSIMWDGTNITWYLNGSLLRTQAVSTTTFCFDSSFETVGSVISDMGFGSAGQGQRTRKLCNMTPSTTFLSAGQFLTFSAPTGEEQLVVLTADLVAGSDGTGTATFEPARRFNGPAGRLVTYQNPTCLMAMDSPELGWSVDPGAVYGFGFSATEAF